MDKTLFISRKQLAERWGLTTATLKRREKDGSIPFIKLGREVRYKLKDIEQIEEFGFE
jgi:predicted DNA-binding transcriptional regulator AlpA